MPVRGAKRRCKYPQELECRAEEEDGAEVARVCETACEGADKEEEKYLDGADPGNGRGREVERGGVVGLEYAEGIDVAPGVHHHEMGGGDCAELAFGV